MKKYVYCIGTAMLATSLLTGCGSGVKLSEEENNMVAEYMATALLKHDSIYEDELIYTEQTEQPEESSTFIPVDDLEDTLTEEEKPDATPSQDTASEETKEDVQEEKTSATLEDIFNQGSYKVSYVKTEECKIYSEKGNDYYIVDAPSGFKLAVAKFKITNTTSKDITVNLSEEGITYSLSAGDVVNVMPLLTAFMTDLQYYNETIGAGKSRTAVVIFSIDEDISLADGILTVERKSQNQKADFPVK